MLVPRTDAVGRVALPDGAVVEVPSDAEVVPTVSYAVHASSSHFLFIVSDSERQRVETSGASSADPAMPKLAGDEPGATPSRRPRAASEAARREGNEAFKA